MPESRDSPLALRDLRTVLRHQETQRLKRRDELKTLITAIPVPAQLLKEVVWLGPAERKVVLQHHPGHGIDRKLTSLWQMLAIFGRAHTDIVAQLDAFHEFSLSEEMHLPVGRSKLAAIVTALNKELVAFSAAAGALVQFGRRLRGEQGLPDMQPQIAAMFDAHEHDFVIALRNLLSHEEFPDLGWQIEYGRSKERRTDFVLSPDRLHQQAGLPAGARAYVARSSTGVRLRTLVDSYAERVRAFYAWYKGVCTASEPLALQDYRRVVKACKANDARTMHRLLIAQFVARNVDPYQHLHKFLLPDQVTEAMTLPLRSKMQVDFIIQAADEFDACDDELRSMVYRLFGVSIG
jgi:hypothetical protein